jgi:hypothetical protein
MRRSGTLTASRLSPVPPASAVGDSPLCVWRSVYADLPPGPPPPLGIKAGSCFGPFRPEQTLSLTFFSCFPRIVSHFLKCRGSDEQFSWQATH